MGTGNFLRKRRQGCLLVAVGIAGGGAALAVASVPDSSGVVRAYELEELGFVFRSTSVTWTNGGISTSNSWAAPSRD